MEVARLEGHSCLLSTTSGLCPALIMAAMARPAFLSRDISCRMSLSAIGSYWPRPCECAALCPHLAHRAIRLAVSQLR